MSTLLPETMVLKIYVFELTVSDTYPKGNPTEDAHRSASDIVSVIVTAEQNVAPDAAAPIDLIVAGDLKAYRIGRVFRISSIQVSRFLKSKEIKNTRSY